ncbi:uncharacterized protein METZ01_LOCUS168808, partial [marine metagenome]
NGSWYQISIHWHQSIKKCWKIFYYIS